MALSTGSKVFLAVSILLVGAVGGGLWWVNDQLSGEPGPGDPVEFEVASGDGPASVADRLVEQGVVKNALAFRLVARQRGLGGRLRTGSYALETGMSVDEAIDVLLQGPPQPDELQFRVEEGLSIPLTLERLAEQFPQYEVADFQAELDARIEAGANTADVLQLPSWVPDLSGFDPEIQHPFEGLLFPNTYRVFADATPRDVLQRMIDQLALTMEDTITAEQLEAAAERGVDRYQGVIIASLVERETRVDDERALVSGVIYNRLAQDQPLQIDATVLYALGEWKQRVLTRDTDVDSPYNTYQNPGLPPTPISGFGAASLQAAFAPEETDFFYYVVDAACDGSHAFAETLEEHNRNVAAFREAGRCQENG